MKNTSFKEICSKYIHWVFSDEYQESYKWDFISQFGTTFSQLECCETFKDKYIKLLSFTENFYPRDILFGKKFFKDIFIKYPQQHIDLFQNLFNESLPLNKRINTFLMRLEELRIKESYQYSLHYQVPIFFLFIKYPNKYPLATTNNFIKSFFQYMRINDAKGLRGVDLYLYFYSYIHNRLLPILKQEVNQQCTVMDAQDFCWFIGTQAENLGNISNKELKISYQPRNILKTPSDLQEDAIYTAKTNIVFLSPEKKEFLKSKIKEQPTRNQILQHMIRRNPLVGKLALDNACFNCEVDKSHPTFIAKTSKLPYMEAHHLIPLTYAMTFYERYHINLDRPENIVSLCPNCHRAIHFGTDEIRNKILNMLLKKRKNSFKILGIDITLSELSKLY